MKLSISEKNELNFQAKEARSAVTLSNRCPTAVQPLTAPLTTPLTMNF